MGTLGSLAVSIIGDPRDLEKSFAGTKKKMDQFSKDMKKMGDSIGNVGKSMSLKVTAPIMAVGAAAHLAWKEVDDALDTIVTKTGATGGAMKEFEASFKNVAKTMPVEMQTVGDAIGEVNTQTGLTGKALEDAAEQAIMFSKINGQDVSRTAIDARQAIEAFELSIEDWGMVLDSVTKTAQDTGQSTDALFDRVTKGAPQLKALNMNFAQGVNIMGKFEQHGLDSSKALSYLARAQVTFAKDGKTMEQGLDELIKRMSNSKNETEALTIAAEVFGTKGATFMYDAIQRGVIDMESFSKAAEDASGAVKATFEETLDPADQMTIAMNNLKLVGADLGGTIQATLAPMLEKLVGWLQKAQTWFEGLSEGQKRTIVVVAGLVAAIGPLLVVIGTIVSSIGALIPVLGIVAGAFGAVTLPVLGVVVAVVAAIAIVTLLIKNWDKIGPFFKNLWSGVLNIFKGIPDNIKKALAGVWDAITSPFKKAKETIAGITDSIKGAINKINPFAKHSPSLVEQVQKGTQQMLKDYKKLETGLKFAPVIQPAAAQQMSMTRTINNYITINNPVPEKASDSTRKEMLRLQYMGVLS